MFLIIGALCVYQNYANVRAEAVSAYEAEEEAARKLQAEYDAMLAQSEENSRKDGVFTGKGNGFGGEIEVEVKGKDHQITEIEILSAEGEDSAYLSQAKTVLDKIILSQNINVDTVSGATFSSTGILDAVADALEEGQ